ncbi:MAG: toll/interleukin-1 receptor domain-containing protein [Oscillibacter sp.]|nr:toll/interleukin-1 receptor domain-containing protein [Oscillibacter sp.]
MKLFISWSGDFSREVAAKLSDWIPLVNQSVKPFFSPDDISKGENWDNRLSNELESSNFGIVCLTPENVSAPWIHFEAGALAKSVGARVFTFMLGIHTSDIKGPLARFQYTVFDRDDLYKLIKAINNATESPREPTGLKTLFDLTWPKFETDIQAIIQKYEVAPKEEDIKKNDHEALQEILQIVRKLDTARVAPSTLFAQDSPFEAAFESTSIYHDDHYRRINPITEKWETAEERRMRELKELQEDLLKKLEGLDSYASQSRQETSIPEESNSEVIE